MAGRCGNVGNCRTVVADDVHRSLAKPSKADVRQRATKGKVTQKQSHTAQGDARGKGQACFHAFPNAMQLAHSKRVVLDSGRGKGHSREADPKKHCKSSKRRVDPLIARTREKAGRAGVRVTCSGFMTLDYFKK